MLCFNFIRDLILFSFQFLGLKQNEKKLNQFARVYKIKTQLIKQLLTISSFNQLFK